MPSRALRILLVLLAAADFILAIGFHESMAWATAAWPWTHQPLDYALLSAFLFAGTATVLWIAVTEEWGALVGALIDVGLFNAGLAAWLWIRFADAGDSAILHAPCRSPHLPLGRAPCSPMCAGSPSGTVAARTGS